MLKAVVLWTGLGMQLCAQVHPSPLLLIHRDILRPGNEAAYREIEEDTARLLRSAAPITSERQAGFPNACLAAEPLTGPREVWFLTGWQSIADFQQVGDEYRQRGTDPLISALASNAKKKAALTAEPVSVFAHHRAELSGGEPWRVGRGRFLVIRITKEDGPLEGAVYESDDHARFVIAAAQSREDADAKAVRAGSDAKVFAVRPCWTRPAKEWVAADPAFWK
jgi:hypothetical protein